MKSLVVYYSLSGTTRAVAASLAKELGADLAEIRCGRYAPGARGYWRAVFDSLRRRSVAIEPLALPVSGYDLVIIGGPIWTGHIAAPVRSWLLQQAGALPGVAFFLTHGGSAATAVFREMELLVKAAPRITLALRQAEVEQQSFRPAIDSFVSRLRVPLAA